MTKLNRILLCLRLILFLHPAESYFFPETKLQLLSVMFRHGDRTPDTSELIHFHEFRRNESYISPVGVGQLTNRGKLLMYNNGVMFRKMYDKFLGGLLSDGDIAPYVTKALRTGTSMLAFLAGLYPPVNEQQWTEETPSNSSRQPDIQKLWNPIPYIFDQQVINEMVGFYRLCPEYIMENTRVENLPENQKKILKYKDLFEYLTNKTRTKILSPVKVYYILGLFIAEKQMGKEIPDWALKVWDEMKEVTDLNYQIFYHTDKQKQLTAGSMVKRILNQMVAKSKGTLIPANRKLFIYSGHDISVAPLYAAFGGSNGFVDVAGNPAPVSYPSYGSTFIVELHKVIATEEYAVKFLYHNFKSDEPLPLRLVDCEMYCPLKQVITLTQNTSISRADQIVACISAARV